MRWVWLLAALVMLAGCKAGEGGKCSKQGDCKPGLECDDYRCTDRRRIRECRKRCADDYDTCYRELKCHPGVIGVRTPKECAAMRDVCTVKGVTVMVQRRHGMVQ